MNQVKNLKDSPVLLENNITPNGTREKFSFFTNLQIAVFGFIVAAIVGILYKTIRYEHRYLAGEEPDWDTLPPHIFTFWHGEQLMLPLLWTIIRRKVKFKTFHSLSSQSKDGRIAATALTYFGMQNIPGSSNYRSKEASRALAKCLINGSFVSITPDGPHGPYHKAKPGVVRIAKLANAPIYPLAVEAEKVFTLKSWDKMFIPYPFSKVVFIHGKQISADEIKAFDNPAKALKYVEDVLDQMK
jgi:lysophospholipid acyltransferase (LPLAT)-like uncharacterized protein